MAVSRRALPTVALLHYTAPPVPGGVEQIVARQARLLAAEGFEVRLVAGRAQAVGGGVRLQRVPLADSRHRRVMAVTQQLEDGRAGPAFDVLSSQLEDALGRALKGVDICLAHNVLTLHKNLALTAALHRLAASTPALRIVAWCHDLAWTNPQYRPALHRGRPWTLLTTPIGGATYVAVSRERQRQIAQALGAAARADRGDSECRGPRRGAAPDPSRAVAGRYAPPVRSADRAPAAGADHAAQADRVRPARRRGAQRAGSSRSGSSSPARRGRTTPATWNISRNCGRCAMRWEWTSRSCSAGTSPGRTDMGSSRRTG